MFPGKWKKAIITPVLKVPKSNKSHELRSINIVPLYKKIIRATGKRSAVQTIV